MAAQRPFSSRSCPTTSPSGDIPATASTCGRSWSSTPPLCWPPVSSLPTRPERASERRPHDGRAADSDLDAPRGAPGSGRRPRLDGRYVLGTNAADLDAAQMLERSKQRAGPEKRVALVKGPLAVRPIYVHKE